MVGAQPLELRHCHKIIVKLDMQLFYMCTRYYTPYLPKTVIFWQEQNIIAEKGKRTHNIDS